MAILKYKDGNEWKKVSIGGGGSTEEVYVGSDAPTDENVKVWIDPTGTPSSPSQPSAGVEVIDNLESDSATAALSANMGRELKEMIEELPSGGGGSASGTKIYVVPEGVLNATMDAPYTFTSEESKEFLSQGNFANTIVAIKTNVEGSTGMSYGYAHEVINMGIGILVSVEKRIYHTNESALIKIQITQYIISIGDFDGSGEIMGVAQVSSGKINL